MTITHSPVGESHVRLMQAIGQVIMIHTMTSPMQPDDIAGVLGFCAGATLANGDSPARMNERRQMVLANIDHAIDKFRGEPKSGLILPFAKP